MMFLKKKTALLVFKVACLIFVTFLLFVFIKVLCVNEKITSDVKYHEKIKHSSSEKNFAKSKENFFVMNFFSENLLNISEEKEEKCCYSKYLYYYVYALILGAYVNVKRLYKMGPI